VFAVLERSWRGTSLSLELAGFSSGGKSVFVPYMLSASNTGRFAGLRVPRSGTAVKRYFLKNGKCLFFAHESPEAQKALYAFARFALNRAAIDPGFGGVKTISLAGLESGAYYSLLLGTDGSASLIKE
jgi:hypothetical protein